jgi:hypothetical protein
MEKNMRRKEKKLTVCFLIAFIALFSWFGEASAQTKKQFSFDSKAKSYAVDNSQAVEIFIDNIGRYDTVTVEAQANSRAIEVKGWNVFYSSNSASREDIGASEVERIDSLPEESISFKSNTLMVASSLSDNKRAAIHLLLPTAIRAKLYINGQLVQSGTVSNSTMVQGSRLTSSNKGYSPRATILQTISREPTNNENRLRRIDSQVLLKLATKVVNAPKLEDKGQKWAMVQVTINQQGLVSSTFYAGGDQTLANIASESLKQFIFQPFLVNDQAIVVTSLINVFSTDGQIKLFSQGK